MHSNPVPGGVVSIDPSQVISEAKAEPYEVLPQGPGLAQLVAAGSLKRLSGSRDYKIVRAIPRFPAGLNGGHSVRFLLGRGIPMPAGSPGHSCVISEETGLPIGQSMACH